MPLEFVLNGSVVSVPDARGSLLEVLRDRLGVRSAKDGCSPQGQCGCCTVWVDGAPRVSCVTPATRIAGREVTTLEGLADAGAWAERFVATGASQCGFCTPGIIMRLAALDPDARSEGRVRDALLAHLCRCTGWNTIVEAVTVDVPLRRDLRLAAQRAAIEGGVPQHIGVDAALGRSGFPCDTAPLDALVAVLGADGEWHVGESLDDARRIAGRVQGRRTTEPLRWPLEVPDGDWVRTLRTTWVEPAYLEPAAAWCRPGDDPVCELANGGAFGAKSPVELVTLGRVARRLADRHGRPVIVAHSRDDAVRLGAKRPPVAGGVRADGTGVLRVVRTPGIAAAIEAVAPGLVVEEVDVVGPPTSAAVRAAGWAEAVALLDVPVVRAPSGATAHAGIAPDGTVRVSVACGDALDEVVLRSYVMGAAAMALGWVRSEAVGVDEAGTPLDVTVRSFGVLRAVDMPPIEVHLEPSEGPAVNGSDAAFAAVAIAAWRHAGFPERWPTLRT